jgi:hypothetical protein
VRAKVTGQILTLDETLQDTVTALLSLLDALPADSSFGQLDPPQRRRRTLEALKRVLLRESQVQPLLLVFEDLHWIDAETQALLDSVVESLPTAQLLLLVNYRPEYQHTWGSKTYYTQLRLDPLPPGSAEEFLVALLGNDPSLIPLKQLLIMRTEGNPFFLEESVRTLVETSVLVGEPGAYRLAQAVPTIQVPATVQAVLAARIDRLPSEDKRLLQTTAVIGTDVPFALLRAIADVPEEMLHRGLARLQAAEFLYESHLFPEPVLDWENLKMLITYLTGNHLTVPVLILSLTGMGWAVWKRDPRVLYFGCLILSTYIFFSLLRGKDARYAIFWIPAFSLCAALPLCYLQQSKALRIVSTIALGITCLYQVTLVYARVPSYAVGYDEAAQYVLRESKGPTIFFDGYNNGYFIYFIRAFDPQKSRIVLRGDKLLSSSSIVPKHWLKIHVHSAQEIENILNQYGTTHIVVESADRSGIAIHQAFRAFLDVGPFRLVKEIPIESNRAPLEGQMLKIYEYLSPQPMSADWLELRLPIVGKTLGIPLDRLRRQPRSPDPAEMIFP